MRSFLLSLAIPFSLIGLIPIGASAEQGGLEKRVAQLETQVAELTAALQEAQEILQFVRVETEEINSLAGPHWIIEGANVHVQSGSGNTLDDCSMFEPDFPNCESLTGLGNLIVGYNDRDRGGQDRSGSHNLVVGRGHSYASFGGLVAGGFNTIRGAYASVCGGERNIASGDFSSVSGGFRNRATERDSSVSGGRENEASGLFSSVSGGAANLASGALSSVSGGDHRVAPDEFNWAAGGLFEPN
jgi:hypothetical protein